jgi:hypothetical protein
MAGTQGQGGGIATAAIRYGRPCPDRRPGAHPLALRVSMAASLTLLLITRERCPAAPPLRIQLSRNPPNRLHIDPLSAQRRPFLSHTGKDDADLPQLSINFPDITKNFPGTGNVKTQFISTLSNDSGYSGFVLSGNGDGDVHDDDQHTDFSEFATGPADPDGDAKR